ncbi:2-oxoglutarate-dependent dioxygenase family protein [Euphorbia peplus]|nr:2-oxoglutarate-dependent dioxygenase family protein [Euphorbia peplus]
MQDTSSSSKDGWSKRQFLNKRRKRLDLGPEVRTSDSKSRPNEIWSTKMLRTSDEETALPTQFGRKTVPKYGKKSKSVQSFLEPTATDGLTEAKPFDICLPKGINTCIVNSASHESYEEEQILGCAILESPRQVLQPGMVLLKHYISHNRQVKIVKLCQELGLGPGGFYRPGYQGGGKLNLHMMCLGLNWDPNTRKYEDERPIDGCKPPGVPGRLKKLVKKAIRDAHSLIKADSEQSTAEEMLPAMSPNICIVNFYTETGRLGLHQDRDESEESRAKGLPVVSFSVGDSAEFVYGDERDVKKAKNLVLESGDVLIFGGKSRHIYHGITSIIPNTTPSFLLQQTGIRPGRLNLTFRQF